MTVKNLKSLYVLKTNYKHEVKDVKTDLCLPNLFKCHALKKNGKIKYMPMGESALKHDLTMQNIPKSKNHL